MLHRLLSTRSGPEGAPFSFSAHSLHCCSTLCHAPPLQPPGARPNQVVQSKLSLMMDGWEHLLDAAADYAWDAFAAHEATADAAKRMLNVRGGARAPAGRGPGLAHHDPRPAANVCVLFDPLALPVASSNALTAALLSPRPACRPPVPRVQRAAGVLPPRPQRLERLQVGQAVRAVRAALGLRRPQAWRHISGRAQGFEPLALTSPSLLAPFHPRPAAASTSPTVPRCTSTARTCPAATARS
jgi:hypothetical protein